MLMQNIINIALNDLRIFFSHRGNLIGLTVLPIFLTIAIGVAFGGSIGGSGGETPTIMYHLDVIDNDHSESSAQLISSLQATGILRICPIDEDCQIDGDLTLEASIQRLEDNVITATIVIPEGFEADLQAFQNVSLPYYTDESLQSGNPVSSTVSAIVEKMNSTIVAGRVGGRVGDSLGNGFTDDDEKQAFIDAVYDRATTLIDSQPLVIRYILSEQGEQDEATVGLGFGQSVPGIGAMQVLFTVLAGLVTLIRERKQWTLQRLAVLPLTRAEILGGKILTYFTLGMLQYAILLVVGLIVGVNYGGSIIALILLVSAFVLCVTALTFAIATRVTSEDQANSMSTLLALLLAPLGGAWWSLEIVPDFMKIIGHLSPVAWVMDGFNDLIFFGGGLVEVLPEIGILLVASAVLFAVGVRRFQVGD
jgi:ABC-2 type transport system permease protein